MILFLFSIFNMKKSFSIVSPPTFHLAPRSLLLEEAISRSNIPVTGVDLSTLPDETPLKKFVLSIKNDVGASRLYEKRKKWLKEGRKKKFEYRLTGKETKCFCHKFMFLIDSLRRGNDMGPESLRLRGGQLENLWGGGGVKYKKIFAQGKIK